MTDFDPAATAGFPLQEANDWIGRWKAIGGGFWCRQNEEGVEVQLARQVTSGAEDVHALDATIMETELVSQPRLKSAVTTLVANAWAKANLGAQLANMEPQGNA